MIVVALMALFVVLFLLEGFVHYRHERRVGRWVGFRRPYRRNNGNREKWNGRN